MNASLLPALSLLKQLRAAHLAVKVNRLSLSLSVWLSALRSPTGIVRFENERLDFAGQRGGVLTAHCSRDIRASGLDVCQFSIGSLREAIKSTARPLTS